MLYLSLALLAQPLVKADYGWFRMRRENILHGVEMGERRYYRTLARLKALGLIQTRRTAKSTYYRVFARQELAVAPPFLADDGFRQMPLAGVSSNGGDSAPAVKSDSAPAVKSIDRDLRQDVPRGLVRDQRL